jgi:hypothetical protein
LLIHFKLNVAYYGLLAAGLISIALVNRSLAVENHQTCISKVFQDLSLPVGEVERVELGTLVYVNSPNYALLSRTTQTIRTLLERMISHSYNMTTTSGDQPVALADSEQMAGLDDVSWDLWENNNFQDFEINSWHNLTG